MMQPQSPEFLLGYMFSEMERQIIKDITGRNTLYRPCPPNTYTAKIPLLWFGIKNYNYMHPVTRANLTALTEELCMKLDATLMDVFTKRKIQTVVVQEKQYFRFITTAIEDRRRLTVSQIEDLLGYKVTIVSEEQNDS